MNLTPFFQWLIMTSIMGSILTGIILLTKRLFRNKFNATWHHYIWILLIVRLILPFGPESNLSIYNLINKMPVNYSTSINTQNYDGNNVTANNEVNSRTQENTTIYDKTVLNTFKKPLALSNKLNYHFTFLIWLIGVAVILIYILAVNIRFNFRIKRYGQPNNVELAEILYLCRQKIKVNSNIQVIYTSEVKTPSLYGVVKPKILIPGQVINQLNFDEKKYVLMHELAHLKRKDLLVNWLTLVMQIIHWFNPIIWYAFYRMRIDCELACDAYVLSKIKPEEHKKYGETLIGVLQYISGPYWAVGTSGMANTKNGIKERVKMIGKFKKKPIIWTVIAIVFFAVLGIIGLTNSKANVQEKPFYKITKNTVVSDSKAEPNKEIAPVAQRQLKVKIGKADADLADFAIRAELAFKEMSYKVDTKHQVPAKSPDGKNDMTLGLRVPPYDTKGKIISYFEQYWSPEIAQKLYNNLQVSTINGKLYSPIGDPPFVDYSKNDVYVTGVEGDIVNVQVKTVLVGGVQQDVYQQIKFINGKRQIIWRSMQDEYSVFYK